MTNKTIKKKIPIALDKDSATPLYQVTDWQGRHYEYDGSDRKSVTSATKNNLRSIGLEKWKDRQVKERMREFIGTTLDEATVEDILGAANREGNEAADLGTQMHEIIERLLTDRNATHLITDQLEPAVRAWLKWRAKHIDWKLIGTEMGIYGETADGQLYAGQLDALFRKRDGTYVVVDWKTSTDLYEENYMQVATYAHALWNMPWRDHDTWLYVSYSGLIGRVSVEAMIVRLDNEKGEDGSKVFTEECEYRYVDVPWWYGKFEHLLAAVGPNGKGMWSKNPKKVTL